ncbi:hypothetical protein RP20_CCG009059 [Aedes albopictus]|nr:hypothetical protein RP20_CCG009059 [Aedes albopictus]
MGHQNYSMNEFYPPAARMATLVWDRELANIAAANARRCLYEHDRCRNTRIMKNVGQNIGIKMHRREDDVSDEILIQEFIHSWFAEYVNSNPSHIASYPTSWAGYEYLGISQTTLVIKNFPYKSNDPTLHPDGFGSVQQNWMRHDKLRQIALEQ